MEQTEYYILFPNVDNGIKLNELLKAEKISVTITPTPREASKCCGISILINNKDDLHRIKECIAANHVEIIDIFEIAAKRDPKRDKFC